MAIDVSGQDHGPPAVGSTVEDVSGEAGSCTAAASTSATPRERSDPRAEDRDLGEAVRRSLESSDLEAAMRRSLVVVTGDAAAGSTATAAGSQVATAVDAATPGSEAPGDGATGQQGAGRSTCRRVGQQLDRDRPLRRHGALVAGDEGLLPAAPGAMMRDDADDLPAAFGHLVLSDVEEDGAVDVSARVRRVLRRAGSDVLLGHAEADLAARMSRVGMPGVEAPSPEPPLGLDRVEGIGDGSVEGATAVAEHDARDRQSEVVGGAPEVPSGYGPEVGRRRSARIEARSRFAAASQGIGRVRGESTVRGKGKGKGRGEGEGEGKAGGGAGAKGRGGRGREARR